MLDTEVRRGERTMARAYFPLRSVGLLVSLSWLAFVPENLAAQRPVKKPALPSTPAAAGGGASADEQVVKAINEQIRAGWKANKLTPSKYATDHEFLRRASLDLLGRIAKPQEIDQFFKDAAPTRRSRLIERLVASPEYAR